MSKKIASFGATYTTSVNIVGPAKELTDTYRVRVANNTDTIGVYSWDFDVIDDDFVTIINEIQSSTIVKIEVSFKYNNNEDGVKVSFLEYEGPDPKTASAANILTAIQTTELATADILSTNKTGLTIELDDTDFFYYESLLNIANRENITIGMQRHTDLSTSSGELEVSGLDLIAGTSEWRSAISTEPTDSPLLIITYDVTPDAYPRLNMKFTTSDPTTNQDTPSNSLGAYIALNDVAPSSPIGASISSAQTTIPIDLNAALPTKLGLGSVGPEIFQYSVIDTTNHQLTSVTRGIAPNAFPAGFDSFKNAENVYYLHKDATNDLHLLFDTQPANVQYRCVAITNVDSGDDVNIVDGVIGIAQNPDAKSQIVIGVELPRWDAITGTAVDGVQANGDTLFVTNNATVISKADGYYDGALLKLTDTLGTSSYTIADSFAIASDDLTGEFIISPAVTGLAAGWTFVIMPAPAQQMSTDAAAPTVISGRFGGFSEEVEGISVNLLDHGATMQENDLFYVWLKRTLAADMEGESDTGAVLIFRYRDI